MKKKNLLHSCQNDSKPIRASDEIHKVFLLYF